jgi:hypothetical protein
MPCNSNRTEIERREMARALEQLDQDIATGKVRIVRDIKGQLSITNWQFTAAANQSWCEGCALRAIQTRGSWVARSKLQAAGITKKAFVVASHNGHSH